MVGPPEPGDRFQPTRPLKLGRDAPAKMARRHITEEEVWAVLADHVVVEVVEHRNRYVLLGRAGNRPLILVVADDDLDDATVLVSAYEPDSEHGWTRERVKRTLDGEGPGRDRR
jgi:hypothetical protein